jgi:hypothetical protein
MTALFNVPVRFQIDRPVVEIVAAECPHCFALVEESKVEDHVERAHGEEAG